MITQIAVVEQYLLDPNLKHQLMKELEPEILERIKKGFDLYKGTVNINQFVIIMVDVLYQQTQWQKYIKEVLTFIELFLLIDLGHLQKIKFQDFTNYLIDRQGAHTHREECQFVPAETLNQIELQAEKVFALRGSHCLGLLTNGKKNVQILQKKTYKCIENISFGGTLINNVLYLESYRVYCLATNDKHLNFYQTTDHTLLRRFSVPDTILYMLATSQPNPTRLICGSTNGHLYEFSLSKILSVMDKKNKEALKEEEKKRKEFVPEKQYKYFLLNRMVEQQPDITCMDVMQAVEILITGANDSKVRLYDMRQNGLSLSKQLDGHYKGIKAVSVQLHHKLIVSCSFDFDILVWNAYLQHPVARLEGHEAPLMSVACPEKYQIIISLDAKAVMKIWSSENYQLIQNLVIFQNFPPNTSINFVYKHESNLAIVWTKRLRFYQYVVNYNPKLTDDQDLTAVRYSSKNLQVYIGSKRSLKVWSIVSGVQTKNYRDVVAADISIIELDDRQRRLFAGTIDGQISSIDLFSGLIIASYSSHQQEISLLLYNNLHELLISGGWDRKLKIHNDTHNLERIEARENVMRNIVNVSQKDLSGGSFSLAQLVIATHCKTRSLKLWDFEKGFLEAQILVANDICLAMFIDPLPLLVVVDAKGTIYLFSTKYHLKNPYKLLAQWKNMYSIQKASQISFVSSNYAEKNQVGQLILGDEFGYIRVIDLWGFLSQQNIKPVTSEMLGNKNPYRIEDYLYANSQNSSNTHDFTHHDSNNIVPPPSIKQILQIKAHNDRVNYVALLNESQQPLILSAGSDNHVKIWNWGGELRGVMRQGLTDNKSWQYQINSKWCNKQSLEFQRIKDSLNQTQQDYKVRKRMQVIPFTEEGVYEEVNNEQIYKDLREVQGYLQKSSKKNGRLY